MLQKVGLILFLFAFSVYSDSKHADDSASEERPSKKATTSEKNDRDLKNSLENTLSPSTATTPSSSSSTSSDSSSSSSSSASASKAKSSSSKESKDWVDTGAPKELLKAMAEYDEYHYNPELDHVGEMH